MVVNKHLVRVWIVINSKQEKQKSVRERTHDLIHLVANKGESQQALQGKLNRIKEKGLAKVSIITPQEIVVIPT